MQFQRNPESQQHIAKLLVAAVHRQQQGRLSLFIPGTRQFRFGGQHSFNCCGVPCLNDFEKLRGAAHTCTPSESTRSAGRGGYRKRLLGAEEICGKQREKHLAWRGAQPGGGRKNWIKRRMPLSQPVCNAQAAGRVAQRRERSLRTASSISASSSLRVSVTSSPAFSPLSRVMGNSAPPPGGGATK